MNADSRQGLVEAWHGELFGEALMHALRARLVDAADHLDELEAIAQLERLMASALGLVLGGGDDMASARAEARDRAASVVTPLTRWEEFLALAIDSLEPALARFRALPQSQDALTSQVTHLLVRNEVALIDYIRRCAAGQPAAQNDALSPIMLNLTHFLAANAEWRS